jgi:hypothetical protein
MFLVVRDGDPDWTAKKIKISRVRELIFRSARRATVVRLYANQFRFPSNSSSMTEYVAQIWYNFGQNH